MEDNTKIFNVKSVNKTIAVGLISALTICAVKEIELHSLEIFHQDQFSTLQVASGAYGGIAIGGNWLL